MPPEPPKLKAKNSSGVSLRGCENIFIVYKILRKRIKHLSRLYWLYLRVKIVDEVRFLFM